jgi:DNA-binding transcriptional regulator YiaG
MTIRAYHEIYLNKAQNALGDAFDYAINTCHISGPDFVKLFTASSISKRMENGEPAFLAGKSGLEIAADILFETTRKQPDPKPQKTAKHFGRSPEYWIGWAVCYYQWFSARSYSDIFKVMSFDDLKSMYYTLHEADITKFADIADEKIREYFKETNLKRFRSAYGCSQSELAKRSGVSLRSIQMYEQRNKDINKASALSLYRISKVLGCTIENLIEK